MDHRSGPPHLPDGSPPPNEPVSTHSKQGDGRSLPTRRRGVGMTVRRPPPPPPPREPRGLGVPRSGFPGWGRQQGASPLAISSTLHSLFRALSDLMVSPSPLRVMDKGICLLIPPTGLHRHIQTPAGLPFCVPPLLKREQGSTGILTSCPSPTPFCLGLGTD
jgi:hypothetical protein